MTPKSKSILMITTAALSLSGVTAVHAAEEKPFSLSVGAGLEYDSNITVDARDLTTNLGDEALVIEGEADAEFGDPENVEVSGGYDFYQSLHRDLTDFDLQIHDLSVGALHRMGPADLALDYTFSHIRLGGDALLNSHSIRPNIGYLVSDDVYLIGTYEYMDRNYDTLNRRDADRHSGIVDAYYLLSPGQYVYASYQLSHESATGSEFTYWGNEVTVGVRKDIPLAGYMPEWRAQYRYRNRNYSNITPSIGEERSDKRHYVSTSLTFPLLDRFEFEAGYEFIGADSNLEVVDYNEHIVTGTVRWTY